MDDNIHSSDLNRFRLMQFTRGGHIKNQPEVYILSCTDWNKCFNLSIGLAQDHYDCKRFIEGHKLL